MKFQTLLKNSHKLYLAHQVSHSISLKIGETVIV